ncbi:glycosyltransferase family 4 protein [Cyanobacterium stanieri LEGE 03274]|uniref:Glycosyltransferase family 4 protein n=1 Tax=Cyanobacterium stanieri LEGE 03274 TaxID=1828756 RepID=A0ABR9V7E8_9CHRO|nr:glycosyltransferase family 4 protein [Cyanobacterium stanieri]MBE9223825.1 glycosyltransferase family 4 protein [Cyanobacterium stanieri LEGE 03274]
MNILVVTVQVPFIRGGAEILAESLVQALKDHGHSAEIVALPFQPYPSQKTLDLMFTFRLLDMSHFSNRDIDLIIPLKFPAYFNEHPNKVAWLLHQHRDVYDFWENKLSLLLHKPEGLQIKETIINADLQALKECRKICSISQNVSKRLKKYNDLESIVLYHPPKNSHKFHCEEAQRYFFFPSRLNEIKRQHLVLKAISETHYPVKVVFAGSSDNGLYEDELQKMVSKLNIGDRAIFVGQISEAEKIKYYAESMGIIYAPFDEDYGYVTLESMLSSKPTITCNDSGGSLEFIEHKETGIVTQSDPLALAQGMDELWENHRLASHLGKNARKRYEELDISWTNVVNKLTDF